MINQGQCDFVETFSEQFSQADYQLKTHSVPHYGGYGCTLAGDLATRSYRKAAGPIDIFRDADRNSDQRGRLVSGQIRNASIKKISYFRFSVVLISAIFTSRQCSTLSGFSDT